MIKKNIILLLLALMQISCSQSQNNTTDSINRQVNDLQLTMQHFHAYNGGFLLMNNKKWANNTFTKFRWSKHEKLKKGGKFKKAIDTLRYKTVAILDSIERVKHQLTNRVGGGISIKNHSLVTPMRKQGVAQYMIKERKAYQVEKWLNEYVNFLNTEYKKFGIPTMHPIIRSNEKNALYENDPIMRKKDFAHAHFDQVPVIMAVTYLSLFQNMVFRYQEEVQKYIIWSLVDKK